MVISTLIPYWKLENTFRKYFTPLWAGSPMMAILRRALESQQWPSANSSALWHDTAKKSFAVFPMLSANICQAFLKKGVLVRTKIRKSFLFPFWIWIFVLQIKKSWNLWSPQFFKEILMISALRVKTKTIIMLNT